MEIVRYAFFQKKPKFEVKNGNLFLEQFCFCAQVYNLREKIACEI